MKVASGAEQRRHISDLPHFTTSLVSIHFQSTATLFQYCIRVLDVFYMSHLWGSQPIPTKKWNFWVTSLHAHESLSLSSCVTEYYYPYCVLRRGTITPTRCRPKPWVISFAREVLSKLLNYPAMHWCLVTTGKLRRWWKLFQILCWVTILPVIMSPSSYSESSFFWIILDDEAAHQGKTCGSILLGGRRKGGRKVGGRKETVSLSSPIVVLGLGWLCPVHSRCRGGSHRFSTVARISSFPMRVAETIGPFHL